MPEEESNQANESPDDGASGPVGGERLAKARHARGISIREIAKELHLDEPKVHALEENRYDVLGAPVFAKGHLRKYAEIVGVSVDDVLADYYQLNRSVGVPPVVGPPRKVRREISIGPWVGGIVVAIVVAVTGWWWFTLTPEPVETLAPSEPAAPEEVSIDVHDSGAALADGPDAGTVEEAPVTPAEAASFADTTPVEETTTAAETDVDLVLSFTGDCWTEVTDATGRRLFFDLGTDGRVVSLSGVEPLGVLLGNSANVSLRVDGFDYSIPAANRRGNTARLTIYSQ